MALTAAALRDLHRIHQQQADLKDRLTAGPRRVKAAEAKPRAVVFRPPCTPDQTLNPRGHVAHVSEP